MFRPLLLIFSVILLWGPEMTSDLIKLRPFQPMLNYHPRRGIVCPCGQNLVDWVRGYHFEVGRSEAIFDFFFERRASFNEVEDCRGWIGM